MNFKEMKEEKKKELLVLQEVHIVNLLVQGVFERESLLKQIHQCTPFQSKKKILFFAKPNKQQTWLFLFKTYYFNLFLETFLLTFLHTFQTNPIKIFWTHFKPFQ